MGTNAYISKWGNSLAIRIPKPVAEQWGVDQGTAIEIATSGNRLVLRKKVYDLAEMLADIGPGNVHDEVDAGSARGVEAW